MGLLAPNLLNSIDVASTLLPTSWSCTALLSVACAPPPQGEAEGPPKPTPSPEHAMPQDPDTFAPRWEAGQRWHIEYEWTFPGKATRRNPPPFVYTTSWAYELQRRQPAAQVRILATRNRGTVRDCELLFSEDGNLVELPEAVGGYPPQSGVPYLPRHHTASGGLVVAWPVFPLRPGSTLEFPGRGMTQTVTARDELLEIHVTVRHDPAAPYPVRHMNMVWKRDKPWWSTVELRTEVDATSGLGEYGVAGRVLPPTEAPRDLPPTQPKP